MAMENIKMVQGTNGNRKIITETKRRELEQAALEFEDYWCSVPEGNPTLTDYLMTFIFFFCGPLLLMWMLITTYGL